jgi:hypothetical protein
VNFDEAARASEDDASPFPKHAVPTRLCIVTLGVGAGQLFDRLFIGGGERPGLGSFRCRLGPGAHPVLSMTYGKEDCNGNASLKRSSRSCGR